MMTPSMRLKIVSLCFAVLWTLGMIWVSGIFTTANMAITAFGGGVAGYAWYRLMRWQLPRGRVPSRSEIAE